MERTLTLLKPDALKRGVTGEIISRFERVGLKIVGMKMVEPDVDHYHHHYETIGQLGTRRGEKALKAVMEQMIDGPVIAMVLEGIEAISLVRKMVGATEPKEAQPGTIRGDYAHISFAHANAHNTGVPNLIHASSDAADAEQEIGHWFAGNELFSYQTVAEVYTQTKPKK